MVKYSRYSSKTRTSLDVFFMFSSPIHVTPSHPNPILNKKFQAETLIIILHFLCRSTKLNNSTCRLGVIGWTNPNHIYGKWLGGPLITLSTYVQLRQWRTILNIRVPIVLKLFSNLNNSWMTLHNGKMMRSKMCKSRIWRKKCEL